MSDSYFVLKIQYTNKPPETRNINAPTTSLGREAGDIVLGDPQSSGRHAEINFQGGQVNVRDLGSTNGTYFNGVRTPQFQLQPGQAFSIGQTVITLMAIHGAQQKGPAKTMLAMGGMPPRPPGPGPGAPPPPGGGFAPPPPGGSPPPPGNFGGPPPGQPPPPQQQQQQFGGPPPGQPQQQQQFGGPPPGQQQQQFGGPPPGQQQQFGGGPGGPPPGQQQQQQFGGPPPGQQQQQFGGPPPGQQQQMGGPPPGQQQPQFGGGPGGPPPGQHGQPGQPQGQFGQPGQQPGQPGALAQQQPNYGAPGGGPYQPGQPQQAIGIPGMGSPAQGGSTALATGSFKERNPILVAVLFMVTLGIYPIIWFWSTATELKEAGADLPHPVFLFIPILNIFFLYKWAMGIETITNGEQQMIMTILFFFVFSPFGAFVVQQKLNAAGGHG